MKGFILIVAHDTFVTLVVVVVVYDSPTCSCLASFQQANYPIGGTAVEMQLELLKPLVRSHAVLFACGYECVLGVLAI